MRPIPDVVFTDLSDEDIATWQFWMVRFLRTENTTRNAIPVQNCEKLPVMDDLLRSRKVRRSSRDPIPRYQGDTEEDLIAREFYTEDDIRKSSRGAQRSHVVAR
jgi:hypothetical protein